MKQTILIFNDIEIWLWGDKMKGNQIIGIGLLILSITLIIEHLVNIPDFIYLILLIIAVLLEFYGTIKIKKEDK